MRLRHRLSTLARWGLVAAVLLAGCTSTPLTDASAGSAAAPLPQHHVAQRGHGARASFELCRPPCASPTRKTLAHAAGAAGAAAPSAAVVSPPGTRMLAASPLRPSADRGDVASRHARAGQEVLLVQFAFASARLDAAALATLRAAAPRLAQARAVTVIGHTDATGPADANARLAQRRAEAVRQAMASLAPDLASAARVEARGACCFAMSNATPAGRAVNRRVEVVLDPGEEAPS